MMKKDCKLYRSDVEYDSEQEVAYPPATGLGIVSVSEEIGLSENEKSVLLSLSKHMAYTRNKQDLLKVIRLELKEIFYFCQSSIVLISEDRKSMRFFLIDPYENLEKHPGYSSFINSSHSLQGIPNQIIKSEKPLRFDLEEIAKAGSLCNVLGFQYETGIKDIISIALKNENEVFGILTFYSDVIHSFEENDIDIISGVTNQIGIAVLNIIANENIEQKERETQILLSVSAEISKVKDRQDLFFIIKHKLTDLFYFTDLAITLYHPERKAFSVFAHKVLDKRGSLPKFDAVLSFEYSVHDGIHEVALQQDGPVIVDIEDAMKSPNKHRGTQLIYDSGIKEMLLIKLVKNKEVIGFLNILSESYNSFDRVNINLIRGIAGQLSNAISNILFLEEIGRRDEENRILLSISNSINSIRDKRELLPAIKLALKAKLSYSDICIPVYDFAKGTYNIYARDNEKTPQHSEWNAIENAEFPINDGLHNVMVNSQLPVVFSFEELAIMNMPHIDFILKAGIRKLLGVRLINKDKVIGGLVLLSENDNSFSTEDQNLIQRLSHHLATAVSNIMANEMIERQLAEINKYKQQLEIEKLYLQEEAGAGYHYHDIIGSGPGMQKVFHLLSQVSSANSTVLILGETGTGKELIAKAIHNSSPRKDKLMVRVNCAALPANLIESELFGHERGSFTGAFERRIGKFELANHGTLFLDEIGEMPLDLQVKLLRAIQEKEIERVGGKATIKIDVRIIAATNRNLQKEVEDGKFRRDLYYRLNVFPITLPPLRERIDDIPILASHFIDKYAKNAGRTRMRLSSNAMHQMRVYHWPGNIRELEHLIERSILMTAGDIIKEMHLPQITSEHALTIKNGVLKTHEDNERDYIIDVLNRCNGKIFGTGGAAEILNLKVGTLNSKIKKLGIKKSQAVYRRDPTR